MNTKPPPEPPNDQRVPFMTTRDQLTRIDDWWHHVQAGSRSEAIRRLIDIALTTEPKEPT